MSILDELPFVVTPTEVKTEKISGGGYVLELERKAYLLTEETIVFELVQKKQRETTLKFYELAEQIAQDHGLGVQEAIELIQTQNVEASEILANYIPELTALTDTKGSFTQDKAQIVSTLLRVRLNKPTWTLDKTKQLPNPLVDALFEFFLKEQNGWDDPTPDTPIQTPADMGNESSNSETPVASPT